MNAPHVEGFYSMTDARQRRAAAQSGGSAVTSSQRSRQTSRLDTPCGALTITAARHGSKHQSPGPPLGSWHLYTDAPNTTQTNMQLYQ
jgi:hypothetical protein